MLLSSIERLEVVPPNSEHQPLITRHPASWKNLLEETPAEGKAFVEGWIWPHVMTAWYGAKLMAKQGSGLIGFSRGLASKRGTGVMRSTIHRPLQWDSRLTP